MSQMTKKYLALAKRLAYHLLKQCCIASGNVVSIIRKGASFLANSAPPSFDAEVGESPFLFFVLKM